MSEHTARIAWTRGDRDFDYESYSRDHEWRFDSGVSLSASAAPTYLGNPEGVDPEEALVASVSSCHMLTFLAIAARRRLVVDRYDDDATGFLEKNEQGRLSITRVELRPRIVWAGEAPDTGALAQLHELAHRNCFIANTVRCTIAVKAPRADA